jgi:hypothetical protein
MTGEQMTPEELAPLLHAAYWRVVAAGHWAWETEEQELRDGWLAAAREALARAGGGQEAALCGSEGVHGGVRYSCQRKPHPVDRHRPAHRHAAGIDAEYARRMADDDEGEPDLVTWEDDGGDDGENREVAWGTIAQYDQRARAQGAP